MDNFENRLEAIEYELSQIAESEYLEELKKKFSGELKSDVIVNIIPTKDISFKTRSLLSAILDRLELTRQDRLDLEKYIIFGGGDNIEYIKQTLAYLVNTINNKEEINGYYPNMSVGLADNLIGRGEGVPAEFSFRASGGKSIKDGAARIKRLKGNSVVWNQKVEKTYIDQDRVLYNIDIIPQNHKFALIRSKAFGGCYYIPSVDVYDYVLSDGEYANIFVQSHVVDAEYSRIYSSGESGYVQLIDLTLMFSAGNEPTTIEEYYARKPIVEDEYAYNEGEVIHMTAEGIKSVGDNAWDEEWEEGAIANGGNYDISGIIRSKNYIPIIGGEQYHYANKEENYDDYMSMFFYDENKNLIDTLAWSIGTFPTPANARYMRFFINSSYGGVYKNDIILTLVHSGWKTDEFADYQPYWEDRLMFDQRIKEHFLNGMKKWDMVYNNNDKGYIVKGTGVRAYEDGDKEDTTVITDGSSTIYELSTPEIIEYDEPFDLDYRVADFGTEQMLNEQPSAPIILDIIYQFNAVDMIREHELKIAELQSIIATMQEQLVNLTSK